MKPIFIALLAFGLSTSIAESSTLRVTCDDQATGAEISINGKYKGECPIDIQLTEGKFKLKAVKNIDGKKSVFENYIRIGDGVSKRIEVTFDTAGSNVPTAVIKVDQSAIAKQRYEIEMAEYNKSIRECLPKYDVELRKLRSAAKEEFRQQFRECKENHPWSGHGDNSESEHYRMMCGTARYEDGSPRSDPAPERDEFDDFESMGADRWCQKQFTAPKVP